MDYSSKCQNSIQAQIYYLLEVTNPERRRSKTYLVDAIGTSERVIRAEISEMIKNGVPICSSSDSKGYFLAQSREEVEHSVAECRSRIAELQERVNGYNLAFSLMTEKQMSLF